MYQVEIEYFADNFDYLGKGSYTSYYEEIEDIWYEVKMMTRRGIKPGYFLDVTVGYIHVLVRYHPHNQPFIYVDMS